MQLSVALATYNGGRHLPEQLGSFLAQTRLPDELVVCDDRSTDGTVAILEEFRRTAPLPVRVSVNEERLGIVGNFGRAIGLAAGDVIFLADQDDVWAPEKLARHEAAYRSDPRATLVFSDGEVVDGALAPLGYSLWDFTGISPRRRRQIAAGGAFDLLVKRTAVVGCSLSFRASCRDVICPLPASWLHDAWIAIVAAALGTVHALPEPLLRYRQHAAQAVGATAPGSDPRRVATGPSRVAEIDDQIAQAEEVLGRLEAHEGRLLRRDFRALLRGKIAHLRARRGLGRPRLSRWPVIAREVVTGRYRDFSRSLKADLLADLRGG